MTRERFLDEARQIFLHMTAGAEEHRHDANRRHAFLSERVECLGKRRSHELQVREPYRTRGLLREERGQALERLGPLRVARAVREENDGLCRAQWSVARRPS